MKESTHIMIDLETLGTAPGSVILSIGACVFDASGVSPDPAHRFERHIVARDAVRAGLTLDPDTVLWWMHPDRAAARAALLAGQAGTSYTLYGALHDLTAWLMRVQPDAKLRCVWGNGASFDLGLLAAAYAKSGYAGSILSLPWRYSNERCHRTLKALFPGVPERVRAGTHHAALDDALHQAEHASRILCALRGFAPSREPFPVCTPAGNSPEIPAASPVSRFVLDEDSDFVCDRFKAEDESGRWLTTAREVFEAFDDAGGNPKVVSAHPVSGDKEAAR